MGNCLRWFYSSPWHLSHHKSQVVWCYRALKYLPSGLGGYLLKELFVNFHLYILQTNSPRGHYRIGRTHRSTPMVYTRILYVLAISAAIRGYFTTVIDTIGKAGSLSCSWHRSESRHRCSKSIANSSTILDQPGLYLLHKIDQCHTVGSKRRTG